ncbi:MAG: glycosyltransferase family 2 protein [Planctomycetes bacterium]|nr:glycosyltransferase family 2 protein [Planctomycetota bacterium]
MDELQKEFIPISFLAITYNEEANIKKCLDSIHHISDDIHIIDSGSTDKTLEIARSFRNVIVHHNKFDNFSSQWTWGIKNINFKYDWLFAIDADFEITDNLVRRLKEKFKENYFNNYNGIHIKWIYSFLGQQMRYGSHTPRYRLILFRKNDVFLDPEEVVDKRFYVKNPRFGYINAAVIENNLKEYDLNFWMAKHIHYVKGVVQEELSWRQGKRSFKSDLCGLPSKRIFYLKSLYYRLPLYIRPWLYFAHDYFLKLGFLEGKKGFILHFLRNLWYRTLVDHLLDMEMGRLKTTNQD